jgi:hypothetical protein
MSSFVPPMSMPTAERAIPRLLALKTDARLYPEPTLDALAGRYSGVATVTLVKSVSLYVMWMAVMV